MDTKATKKAKREAGANHKGKLPVSGFLPEALVKKARAYCDERGEFMPAILTEALERYMSNPPKVQPKEKKEKTAKAA